MCNLLDKSQPDCSKEESITIWPAVGILLFGSFVRGIGASVYWVVAFPAIDDSLPKYFKRLHICKHNLYHFHCLKQGQSLQCTLPLCSALV